MVIEEENPQLTDRQDILYTAFSELSGFDSITVSDIESYVRISACSCKKVSRYLIETIPKLRAHLNASLAQIRKAR
jgi:hypothetical protein